MPDFKRVDASDFSDTHRITNSTLVDRELEKLGGGGFEGAGFLDAVRRHLGLSNKVERMDAAKSIKAYNEIVDSLNSIPKPRTKEALMKKLGM
ncbi:hypothetical protein [Stenotrophomonas maltophilia]|uniref:hypothetical protein n=1 Tax=Stenotrophomonas maltophilia TaxID=40324 RepID=UPI0013FD3A3F|nr:hypothetical protein [Stenotrophomonas maltophilia]